MKTTERIETLETLLNIQSLILQAENKESLMVESLNNTRVFISDDYKFKLINNIDTTRLAIRRLTRRFNTIKLSIFK